jgi:hypothetical protein
MFLEAVEAKQAANVAMNIKDMSLLLMVPYVIAKIYDFVRTFGRSHSPLSSAESQQKLWINRFHKSPFPE